MTVSPGTYTTRDDMCAPPDCPPRLRGGLVFFSSFVKGPFWPHTATLLRSLRIQSCALCFLRAHVDAHAGVLWAVRESVLERQCVLGFRQF